MLKVEHPIDYLKKGKSSSETLEGAQHVKQITSRRKALRFKRSDDNPKLPENFKVGQAIGGGDCFFDSVAKGLKRLKPEMDFTVKSLREVCKRFAQSQLENDQSWLKEALRNEAEPISVYVPRIEFTADDIEQKSGSVNILGLTSPIWGRSEIEGRIICEEYNVKLHIVEKHVVEGKEVWLDQIVNSEGSRSVDSIDYNEENTIHIINRGNAHFEPILGTQEIRHNKQQSPDPSDYDDEITPEEELINIIKSRDSEEEKLAKIKRLFEKEPKPDINFQDKDNDTPLHIAIRKKELKVIEWLVKNGAKIDIKNSRGRTQLEVAQRLDRQDIVGILKSHTQLNLQASVGEQSAIQQLSRQSLHSKESGDQVNNKQSSNKAKKLLKRSQGKHSSQRRAGTTGSGDSYEIDLLILGKIRGERDADRFYLDTNVDGVGAFDDIVFRYWNEEKSTIILLQAKHVENPEKGKVTIEKFKNPKNDKFYLGKYFSDYLSIREKFNEKSKYPVFQGNSQVKYIIYTNAILDERFDKNRKIDIDNSIFSTKSKEDKDKAFKFSLDDKNSDVIETLESVSCRERIKLLAKALVSCISGKLNYNNMMGNEFFSTYHVFLAKNVIDVGEEIKEDGKKNKYREGRINHNFLNIDNEDSFKKVLKEEVLYEYAKNVIFNEKSSSGLDSVSERDVLVNKVVKSLESFKEVDEDVIEKLGGNVIILDTKNKQLKFADQEKIKDESAKQFIRDLESKVSKLADYKFDIPYEFVKKTLKEQTEKETLKLHDSFGNISPRFKKPKHLIKKLIELFEKYKSLKIIKIDDSVVGHGKSLTDGDIKNIGKLVGNLLVFDENKKMLKLASEESLDRDALELITKLKTTAQSHGLKVDDYRFDIKVKNFPKDILFTDGEDRTNVEEFLSKLEVFIGQASDPELRKVIKDEIRNLYKLTEEEVEDNFLKIRNKAEEHWRKGDFYLEKGDDFFTNIFRLNIEFNVKEPVDLFSGREEELSDLHNKIQRSSEKVTVISQMTSISGLGGIGKTELARKYVHDHGNDYDGNIIWINAESYQTLAESFLRLAQDNLGINVKSIDGNQKDIKPIVEDVYRFFSKRKSLFIFDNAEKSEELKQFLPLTLSHNNKPYVLITSRMIRQEWEQWGVKEGITLDVFTDEEAISFVKEALKIDKGDNSQDNKTRELAIDVLHKFPLALVQAVAHIKEENRKSQLRGKKEYTIVKYLEDYKKEKKKLLNSKAFESLDNDYEQTTLTTLEITADKIKDDKEYGGLALKILDMIAYFAPNNIPVESFFLKLEKDEGKLWKAVDLLYRYSMIKLDQGEADIHPLVQEVTRINLKDREKEVLRKALELFQGDSSQVNLFDDNLRLNNVDHAISVWRYANNHKELVREFSSLPVLIVSELNASLRYQEAYLFGSNALKLLEKMLDDNHPSVLSMMSNIASVLYTQGKDDDALEIYRKLNKKTYIIKKLLMSKDKVVFFDTNIGLILNRKGKHDEALKIFSHLYSLVKKGKINSNGSIEHNVGVTLLEQGRLNDAMEMFKNAIKQKEEVLGPDHESTLNTKNSIAVVLERQGKYEDVLKMNWEIYEKRKKNLGPNHPNTLTTYGNIALSLTKLSRYDEALKIANEVDKEREKLLPDHPRTLKGKLLIVGILDTQGKYDKALEKCKEVYEKRKEVLGPNHPDTLTTLDAWYGLALKFAKQRKYDKALKELNEVLEERKRILKPNHPDILQTEDAISKVRRARDNGADINFKIVDRELFSAAEKGQLEVVNNLLNKGVKVNVQSISEHITPLHLAAQNGHARVVEKLLEKGAEVNAKNAIGSTALHIAAHRNYLDVVNALLEGGADVNCYDNALFRPLHFAAQEGHIKIVELLLKNGGDIEATNIDSLTPLYIAACHKHLNVVKILLEGGANIDAVNKHNMIPDFINKVLLSTKQLPNAIRRKHNKSDVQRLLEDGAVINYFSDTSRLTSLHYAVSGGNLDIVVLLLGKKPDVNVADEDGWTPLHYTAQDGHLDIVKLLLDHRADPTVQNSDRKTPLDLAQEKSSQNPQVYQEIIKILTESINQQQKTDPINQGGEVSSEECLPGPSSGNRRKREAEGKCLFTWEDVDEFNEEKDEKRDFDKIKIDSEKFVSYIKDLPKEKQSQLIQLASGVKVTGESQSLVNKLISNQKVMSHLSRVGRISGMTMHGMMAKNVLVDFLNGDYQGVAVNVGFIAGGQGFAKVAEAASLKGLKLASEGKLLLGRSLRAASPFLARGTSAFVVYDLVNQVKAFKNGTEEALVGVVGDSIYLGVDAAEIGIEIAEAFEVLEGVSSVTGPIGAAVGAVVFVGTDIYMAVKRVDKIDEVIHLTGKERFVEGLRAFIGMQPENHIQELLQEKEVSNQLVRQGLEYLKQHSDIQSYVFPTGKSVVDSCRKVPYKTSTCASGGFGGGCLRASTVTRYAEECTTKFEVDLDNTVQLDRKRTDIKWSRARPDNPSGGELFCLPQGNHERVPSDGSYLCKNAIGVTDLSTTKTGNHTLINLGKGEDYAQGFTDSPNIFVVNDGFKGYYGGNKDDVFILQGDLVRGYLSGGDGIDTLDLTGFAQDAVSVDVYLNANTGDIIHGYHILRMGGMERVLGRKAKSERIFSTCDTQFLDGQGSAENNSDIIVISNNDCTYKMQIIVRSNTNINNNARNGDFNYNVLPGKGKAQINLSSLLNDASANRHNFFFNYTISELVGINVQNISQVFNYTVKGATFSFLPTVNKSEGAFDSKLEERFNVTISDIPANASYVVSNGAEIKMGSKGNLYMLENTDKSVDEIIRDYLVVANRLDKMSFFIQSLLSNETVAIGSGNYEVIHNNPLHKSHLVGNGGENVYVIDSESKRLEIDRLPIPEVVIYDLDVESSVDTIDLRNLVQQTKGEFSNNFKLQVLKSANDLLLKATVEKPTEDSSISEKHEYFTVRLKDGVNWYNKTHVIMDNVPMRISLDNNEWSLKPQPLMFEKDKEVIVVTSQDVEENTELITPRRAGNYSFIKNNGTDLMITNAFDTQDDLCTIVLSKFYETPKMETLSIKFADKEIILKEHQEQISSARNVNVVKKEHKEQVYHDVFNRTEPEVMMLSDQPVAHEHKHRHSGHRHQVRHRRSNDVASSSVKPSSWINGERSKKCVKPHF
ncbi:ankyrin repeat domain-containing protein [Wolbachia endosymbiont (group B) of Endotricha flammealis]|uniref:ankyrin repeat domain-containing protein n=1 Tax=Wolbachia endosymbiont (group B) of Endotricha flammealis TaxID=2954005 RepID=UPI00223251AA|nr:ankyrin repeat domain-containing protein [Wolbachia endosymbiont (group B) of Endotricha flammealis]